MLTAMGDVMREAYKRGWITTRDGNISVRKGKVMYITPSAIRKYTIQVENIVKLPFSHSALDEFKAKGASIEIDMHALILEQPGVVSVVHLHPTYTVSAMHAGFNLNALAAQFVELGRYTKVGPNVPMLRPGSDDLATVTASAIENVDLVGQVGHGVTAKGKNPWHAFEHIERMEHICQIVLASGVSP